MNSYLELKYKLKNKIAEKRYRQNHNKIYIRDLFVYAEDADSSFGEAQHRGKSYSNPYTNVSSSDRLIDHINFLASVANKYYQECYGEGGQDNIIKPEYSYYITRLSLHEFSLYIMDPKNCTTSLCESSPIFEENLLKNRRGEENEEEAQWGHKVQSRFSGVNRSAHE